MVLPLLFSSYCRIYDTNSSGTIFSIEVFSISPHPSNERIEITLGAPTNDVVITEPEFRQLLLYNQGHQLYHVFQLKYPFAEFEK